MADIVKNSIIDGCTYIALFLFRFNGSNNAMVSWRRLIYTTACANVPTSASTLSIFSICNSNACIKFVTNQRLQVTGLRIFWSPPKHHVYPLPACNALHSKRRPVPNLNNIPVGLGDQLLLTARQFHRNQTFSTTETVYVQLTMLSEMNDLQKAAQVQLQPACENIVWPYKCGARCF
ncbi:hypothetical protein T4D_8019 [Trichinella pseudospiralis]|uniref:Uncharacterized protein n=1 Tax=Trichinella pseudospiralis TaxID=6337 RepID=A0A0V1FJW2_TRIPS|nr:hypothetical protein T4D_8019 [Trichinella pseudospiralis]